MSEEKNKQIAPIVVLAQHGNKGAYRDLYIHYYKSIFFICRNLTGDATTAMKLTAEIFIKMFESVDKLNDHMAFEQWFYSLAVNMCRRFVPENIGNDDNLISLAKKTAESAKNRDKFDFEHGIMKIIEELIFILPADEKMTFFYRYAAGLTEDKISLLKKTETEEVSEQLANISLFFEKQAEKIKAYGIDLSMFIKDMDNSLCYISSRTFVPDGVHNEVSEKIGIDVNPFASPTKEKKDDKEKKEPAQKEITKKKAPFTKSDLILFFVIVAAVLLIFSIAQFYINSKDKSENAAVHTTQQQEKPVLLWNGAAAAGFDSGSGSKEDPYIISSGGQLAYLANLINDGNSYYSACHYRLAADILLNDTKDFDSWETSAPDNEWTPIGCSSEEDFFYFSGTFDGADHTIKGMYISDDSDYLGLFGVVRNGHIKNLNISEAYIEGGSYAGGIAGYFSADTTEKSGFEYCSFSGTVKSNGNNAGGITGYFRAEGDGNTPVISNCCAFGKVTAATGYAGGISGVCEAETGNTKIINCFNVADVYSEKNAGGITGNSRCANGNATVEYSYNAGQVTASNNSGAIAGLISCVEGEGRVSIQQCFMLDSSAATDVVKANSDERLVTGSITKLTEEQMQQEESFSDFNFSEIWKIDNNSGYAYPVLRGTGFQIFEVGNSEKST